eukprot:symbB.v1.2.034496.t1/scaffold4463.1/size39383/1
MRLAACADGMWKEVASSSRKPEVSIRQFRQANALGTSCTFESEVGNRSVRDRIATAVHASTASEEFEAESSREQLRSSRDRRMPTPHVSSQMVD